MLSVDCLSEEPGPPAGAPPGFEHRSTLIAGAIELLPRTSQACGSLPIEPQTDHRAGRRLGGASRWRAAALRSCRAASRPLRNERISTRPAGSTGGCRPALDLNPRGTRFGDRSPRRISSRISGVASHTAVARPGGSRGGAQPPANSLGRHIPRAASPWHANPRRWHARSRKTPASPVRSTKGSPSGDTAAPQRPRIRASKTNDRHSRPRLWSRAIHRAHGRRSARSSSSM